MVSSIISNIQFTKSQILLTGAAIHAAQMSSSACAPMFRLIEVTPLSLGLEVIGGLMSVVVARNTKIPCTEFGNYTTVKDNQLSIRFDVYEGERPLIKDNRRLGDFLLSNIPAAAKGVPKIKVIFEIDRNGILHVSAVEQSTGALKKIDIDYGKAVLSDVDVNLMILRAQQFERQDRLEKDRIQAKLKLEDVIYKLKKVVNTKNYCDQLMSFERKQLDVHTAVAENFIKNNPNASQAEYQKMFDELGNLFGALLARLNLT